MRALSLLNKDQQLSLKTINVRAEPTLRFICLSRVTAILCCRVLNLA